MIFYISEFIIFFLSVQQGIIYSSVNLGPPSSMIEHDDLHTTMIQYSTVQPEAQEESSFNEGNQYLRYSSREFLVHIPTVIHICKQYRKPQFSLLF